MQIQVWPRDWWRIRLWKLPVWEGVSGVYAGDVHLIYRRRAGGGDDAMSGGEAAAGSVPLRIGSIVIRCYAFERMVQFWLAALGYEQQHADPNGGFVILGDPAGTGPNVSIDAAPVRRTGKRGWLHLDLYAQDQAVEVERLVQLGAGRYPWRYQPGADFVVLEDPDGNLFCVVQQNTE